MRPGIVFDPPGVLDKGVVKKDMKPKINFNDIEKSLDFEALSQKLDTLTNSGELGRKRTVYDLLDKMKPALLRARENKVSFDALTEFLVGSGIPVSEPTLRQYLAGGKSRKKRHPAVKTVTTPQAHPVDSAQKSASSQLTSVEPTTAKKLPPRLARRDEKATV